MSNDFIQYIKERYADNKKQYDMLLKIMAFLFIIVGLIIFIGWQSGQFEPRICMTEKMLQSLIK